VADEVDERLTIYKNRKGVEGLVGAQEKILVCVNLNFNAEYLIRKGYRVAKMLKTELFVLYVKKQYVQRKEELIKLEKLEQLCRKLDAELKIETAKDPAKLIIIFAKTKNITQIIMGASARTRFQEILKGSIVRKVMSDIKYVDVLVVADPVH